MFWGTKKLAGPEDTLCSWFSYHLRAGVLHSFGNGISPALQCVHSLSNKPRVRMRSAWLGIGSVLGGRGSVGDLAGSARAGESQQEQRCADVGDLESRFIHRYQRAQLAVRKHIAVEPPTPPHYLVPADTFHDDCRAYTTSKNK